MRTHPTECEHGVVIDWGDFGPEDGELPPPCPDCTPMAVVPASVIRKLIGSTWNVRPAKDLSAMAQRRLAEGGCTHVLSGGYVDVTAEEAAAVLRVLEDR